MSEASQRSVEHRGKRARTSVGTARSGDGTTIAFERRGDGPALLLVDGALCHRAIGPSTPLAALLAQDFTVFTYDRRGRGESDGAKPFSVEREIEDLQTQIKAAGGPVCSWGMSSGAALALETAQQSAAVSKLALYEPPFIVDDSRRRIPPDIASQLTVLVAAGRRGEAVRLSLAHALPTATRQVVQGQTHNPKAKALVQPLTDFFSSKQPTTRQE